MIEPVQADLGRKVVYTPKNETGVITSFSEHFVFVRYGAPGTTSAATLRQDLVWWRA